MFEKKTIDDVALDGKRVLIRVDFNVPLDEGLDVADDERILASLPTIRKVLDSGGKAILMSHLGRPRGEVDPRLSLKPVASYLGRLIGREVTMAPDSIGSDVESIVERMEPGDVVLLENLRFHPEEEKNDPSFARVLGRLGDLYINDAFGTAHRAHASTQGITEFLKPAVAGYLLQKEIEYLGNAVRNPSRPFLAILGGAKISGKIEVIRNLMETVDSIAIGGGMAFTFLKAQGFEIGDSLVEEDRVEVATQILDEATIELLLPVDFVVADDFSNDARTRTVPKDGIDRGWRGMDIGPATCSLFREHIFRAKTILWNGPMGVFEMPLFAAGTKEIAEAIGSRTGDGVISIVGGGDSVAAVKHLGYRDRITHLSTGGGASLEFFEGKALPGIVSLDDR